MSHAFKYKLIGWRQWATVICPSANSVQEALERIAWRFGNRVVNVERQDGTE